MYGADAAEEQMAHIKSELALDVLNKIDNRRVLQFLFDERDIGEWGDIGWWSMSHGAVAVDQQNRVKTMKDIYDNIRHFEREGHFEKRHTLLFNDRDDVSSEARSPSSSHSDDDLSASRSSSSDNSLARENTVSFMDEARTIEANIAETGKVVPLIYRIQVRIPFNMIKAWRYMEKLSIQKDESFALSSQEERQKLKKAISIIANRFICLLADKAYYSQKLNAWIEKTPKRKA